MNSFVPRRDFYMYTDGFVRGTYGARDMMKLEWGGDEKFHGEKISFYWTVVYFHNSNLCRFIFINV